MQGIVGSWKYSSFLVLWYGIYKIIKNLEFSLSATIAPMLFLTYVAFYTDNDALFAFSFIFIIASVITSYSIFSIYKSWKEYNSRLYVQYGYDPKFTFRQYYSNNI